MSVPSETQTVCLSSDPAVTVRSPAFRRNIEAGTRLALFRPVSRNDFTIDVGQVLLLFGLFLGWGLGFDYVTTEPLRKFSSWGFANYCVINVFFILSVFAIARIQRDFSTATPLLVLQLAAGIIMVLAGNGLHLAIKEEVVTASVPTWYGIIAVFFVWGALVCLRAVRLVYGATLRRSVLLTLVYLVLNGVPYAYFSDTTFWYAYDPSTWMPREPAVNVEDTYYAQASLMASTTRELLPHRPSTTDLYFVGLGGYADENVFMNEVNFVRDLFDTRFGTQGRSLILNNHLKTVDRIPLANLHNLEAALTRIAERIEVEEDIVFLFVTSHGSKSHKLSMAFDPLEMNDMPASALRTALDRSGIKWRILVISACYSGGFIDALKNEQTLIMTAAAKDRRSFGCGNDRNFTYFGEAYFRDHLQNQWSFIDAFYEAQTAVRVREEKEKRTASEPQIYIGSAIAERLATLERQMIAAVGKLETSTTQTKQ